MPPNAQAINPLATQGALITIKVAQATYACSTREQLVIVELAGAVVTLPQNPQVGVTTLQFQAEQAFSLSGGAFSPLSPTDPISIPVNAIVTADFTARGWLICICNSASPLAPLPAGLQGNIIVDPQNISLIASDSAPITATVSGFTGLVFLSWAGVVRFWGSNSANYTLNTNVVFVSNHTDNTDPVIWNPTIRNGALVSIQGSAPTVVATVVLAGVVPKSRVAGSNSALQANLGPLAAVGQIVENTTHSSRAVIIRALGGNNFLLGQPMVKGALGSTATPAEVDTWANGDSVKLLQPIKVNIARFDCTNVVDFNGAFNNFGNLFQLTVFDPTAPGNDDCYLQNVLAQECVFEREVIKYYSTVTTVSALAGLTLTNCLTRGALDASGTVLLNGGGSSSFVTIAGTTPGLGSVIDGDYVYSGGAVGGVMFIGGAGVTIGLMFMDTGGGIVVASGQLSLQSVNYGAHVIYGAAAQNIALQADARMVNLAGTWVAALTFPVVIATGIMLNNVQSGSTHTGASPDVLTSAVASTVANADAAFNGLIFQLGGSSMSKAV